MKGSILHKDLAFLHNNTGKTHGARADRKQGETDESTTIAVNFNTLLSQITNSNSKTSQRTELN